MDSHPGGKEILLLAAGRDITYAFDSYHPFTEKPEQGKHA
jgi:cytochrome b involved in lipid metabolism